MTKRTSGKFKRRKQDTYDTPPEAVSPLLPHLDRGTEFTEPCAGKGLLSDALEEHGHFCISKFDIKPRGPSIKMLDAFALNKTNVDAFITNPPWTRKILHPLIIHLSSLAPTWLLFDADWKHTQQAAPYLKRCKKIVSAGRISWMFNNQAGFDNAAWYLFGPKNCPPPKFYGLERSHVHD